MAGRSRRTSNVSSSHKFTDRDFVDWGDSELELDRILGDDYTDCESNFKKRVTSDESEQETDQSDIDLMQ